MRWFSVVGFILAASRALAVALPRGAEHQQTPLGWLTRVSDVTGHYMSCEETYGRGWEKCGGETSRFCYNPSLGQSCCERDNSYCDSGTYCAPVPGYCCFEGEDLDTCARNAGFALPGARTLSTFLRP